ncbi:MAG: sigma-54 dependent transcriptional regulator [Desulfobacteraceae bacterium]|jgi:DNA-binding NtrC family response regulator
MKGKILIVDDEKDMLVLLSRIIEEDTGHGVTTESNPEKALALFEKDEFDLVILDMKMPGMSGLELLKEMKAIRPDVSVIIVTAYATIDTAVEAIREGAFDYITKPFQRERIVLTVEKVIKWRDIVSENIALRKELGKKDGVSSIIGSSGVINKLIDDISQVAPTTATVLITGESGTGKELVAKALHQLSMRKTRPLITVNCTAISENVIESELFGHVKGAFTGAWKDKKGLVAMADGGTLFLDEIGDLNPSMQTKLLRLIQEGEYKPVGSTNTQKADIRFIAATNHNLEADIQNGTFREDLFYRLNVVRLGMPSLNDRREDIPLLAHHFLKKYTLLYQKNITGITSGAVTKLCTKEFSGNIRELENIIERGVIFCRSENLDTVDILMKSDEHAKELSILDEEILAKPFREARDEFMIRFFRQYIQARLRESNGNISQAAETAGIQRQYMHRLMKQVGLEAEGFKERNHTVS